MAYDKEKARSVYSEKLRDPRWQKKRLEVMQRDEFTCQICFDSASTLNVHHNYYERGKDPWDYPIEALVTLCENCHEDETSTRPEQEQFLLLILRRAGFKAGSLNYLSHSLLETFGDSPHFHDNDEAYLNGYLRHFHAIAWDVEKLIQEYRKKKKAEDAQPNS